MTTVTDYIRIALAKANGDRARAKAALVKLAQQDDHFAQLLAAPYWDQIATQALNEYLGEEAPVAVAADESQASDKHRDAVMQMVAAFKKTSD